MDDDWDLDLDALDQLAALEQQALAQRQQVVHQQQQTPWVLPGPAAHWSCPASHVQQWQQHQVPPPPPQQQPWQGAYSAQHIQQGADPSSGGALPQRTTENVVHQQQELHRPQPLAKPGSSAHEPSPSVRPFAESTRPRQQPSAQAGPSWKPNQPVPHQFDAPQQQQQQQVWQRQDPQQQASQGVYWQPAPQNAAHAPGATGPNFAPQNGRISGGGKNVGSVQRLPSAAQAQPQHKQQQQQQGKPNSAPSQLKQASLYSLWSSRTVAPLPSASRAGLGSGGSGSGGSGSASLAQVVQHGMAPAPASGWQQQQQLSSGAHQQDRAGLGSLAQSGPSSVGLHPVRPPQQQQHQQRQPAWHPNPGSGSHPGCQPLQAAAHSARSVGAVRAAMAPGQQPSGHKLPVVQQQDMPRPQGPPAAGTCTRNPSAGGCGTAAEHAAQHDLRQAAGEALAAGWLAPSLGHGTATAANATGQQQQRQQEGQDIARHRQQRQGHNMPLVADTFCLKSVADAHVAGEVMQGPPQVQQEQLLHSHTRPAGTVGDVIDLCEDEGQWVGGGAAAHKAHQPQHDQQKQQQQQQQQHCTASRQQEQQVHRPHQQTQQQPQLPANGQCEDDWADFPSVSPGLWDVPSNNIGAPAGTAAATGPYDPQEHTPAAAAARPLWQEAQLSGGAAAAAAAGAGQEGESGCMSALAGGVEGGEDVLPVAEGGEAGYLVDCRTTSGGIQLHSFNARHWVYPKGVQERRYQLSCIETALLHNTLVCLPTGLGKTLIAAVVMHNFTRWFPQGKVVFVAPTRPLVNQQIDACYNFMGVSKTAMAELTGTVKQEERQRLWQQEHMRIYFATPQTFYNDVKKGICPYEKVVCLIVDECHRATGNYDIVNAVKHMRQHKCKFRVVGLSATPGSDASKVQEVIDSLMVCRVEHRTESDAEVLPHVHQKDIDVEIVEPSREVELLRQSLLQLLRQVVGQLAGSRVYQGTNDAERVSRYMLLSQRNVYQERGGQVNFGVMQLFQQGMFLADLRDQMDLYGLSQALTYLNLKLADNWGAKKLVTNPIFGQFRQQLEACLRACAQSPKMKKLVEVLRAHFQEGAMEAGSVGRVIIFTNLRESVNEIVESLKAHEPLITARMFIGQGGGAGKSGGTGMRQKEQKAVLADFRAAKFNVLVATSIGEEGLDIPQVDLIVCYDATASPTRAIQRMGRTGRHREGRVVYILAAGKEAEKYKSIEQNMRELNKKLAAAEHFFNLYTPNPRMLPREITPRRLDVAVQHLTPEKGAGEGKGSGRGRASGRGRGSGRGGKAAAAPGENCGGAGAGAGAGEEGVQGKGGTAGAAGAAAGDSGRRRGAKRARAASGRGRGRGRAAKPAEPIVIDDEEDDSPEHRPAAPADSAGAGPSRPCAAQQAEQQAAQHAQHGQAEMAAGILEGPSWSDADMPDMPTPASPVLGLLGEQSVTGRGATPAPADIARTAGAADLQEGRGGASRLCNVGALLPCSSCQTTSAPGKAAAPLQRLEQQVQEAVLPKFELLFPESAGVLSWDAAGRLSIAPPPALEALLRPAAPQQQAAAAVGRQGPTGETQGQGRTAAAVKLNQPGPVQPPGSVSQEGSLHVSSGVVVRLQDPSVHRWAFVAAVGAPRRAERQPSEASPGVAVVGGRLAGAGGEQVAAGNEPAEAEAKPSGTAGNKKSSKAAPAKPSKPRKRKAKALAPAADSVPAEQQAGGVVPGADPPPFQPGNPHTKQAAAATGTIAEAALSTVDQQQHGKQASLTGRCCPQQVPFPAFGSTLPPAGRFAGLPAAGPVAGAACETADSPGLVAVAEQPPARQPTEPGVVHVQQPSPLAVPKDQHGEPPLAAQGELGSHPEDGYRVLHPQGQQVGREKAGICAATDADIGPSASQLPLRARLLLRAQQAGQELQQPGGGEATGQAQGFLAKRTSRDAVPAAACSLLPGQQLCAAVQVQLCTGGEQSLKPGPHIANKENRANSPEGDGTAGAEQRSGDAVPAAPLLPDQQHLAISGQEQLCTGTRLPLKPGPPVVNKENRATSPKEDCTAGAASGGAAGCEDAASIMDGGLRMSQVPLSKLRSLALGGAASAAEQWQPHRQQQQQREPDLPLRHVALQAHPCCAALPREAGSSPSQQPLRLRRQELQASRQPTPPVGEGQQQAGHLEKATGAGAEVQWKQAQQDERVEGIVPGREGSDEERLPLAKRRVRLQSQRNTAATAGRPTSPPPQPMPNTAAAVPALSGQPSPCAVAAEQGVLPAPVSKWSSRPGQHAWQGGLQTQPGQGREEEQRQERWEQQPAGPPAVVPSGQQPAASSHLSASSWEVSGEADEEELPLGRRRRKLRKKRRSPGGAQGPSPGMGGGPAAAVGENGSCAAANPTAQTAELSFAAPHSMHARLQHGVSGSAATANRGGSGEPADMCQGPEVQPEQHLGLRGPESAAVGVAQEAQYAFDYMDDSHDADLGWDDHDAYCPGTSLAASWHAQRGNPAGDGPPKPPAQQQPRVGGKGYPTERAEQRQQAQQDPFSFASASPWGSEEDPWSEDQEPHATPRLLAPHFQSPTAGSRPPAAGAAAAAGTTPASLHPSRGQPAAGTAAGQPTASAQVAGAPRQHAGPAATPLPRHPSAGRTHGGPAPSPAHSSQPLQLSRRGAGATGCRAVISSQTPLAGRFARQAPGAVRGRVLQDTPASDMGGGPAGKSQASPEWAVPGSQGGGGTAAAGARRGPVVGDTPEALAGAAALAAREEAAGQATEQQQQQPARKRLKKAGGQQQQQHQQPRQQPKAGGREGGHARGGGQQRQDGVQEKLQKNKRKASRFLDMEAGVSEDEQVSGDEEEGDEDGFLEGFIDDATQAPPSTGGRSGSTGAYRQPLFGGPGQGPSPSPLGQLRSMLARGRQARGGRQVQDTPGASGAGAGDSQDDYDYDDSFLATEEGDGATHGSYDSEGSHEAACAVCRGEEGEVLLCEGCPAVYHPACCGLHGVPEGDWYCPLCSSDRPTPRPGRRRGSKPQRHRVPPQSTARAAAWPSQGQQRQQQQLGQQQQQQQQQARSQPRLGHAGSGSRGAESGDWDGPGVDEDAEAEAEDQGVGPSGQELSNTFSLL